MKIGLQSWGSHGDIVPFLMLARELSQRGHQVELVLSSVEDRIYTPAEDDDYTIRMVNPQVEEGLLPLFKKVVRARNALDELKLLMRYMYEPITEAMYKASVDLCKNNDIVVGHMLCHTLLTASEKYNCPRAVLALAGVGVPSAYQAPTGLPNWGKWSNRFFWKLVDWVSRKVLFKQAEGLRRQEGLAPVKSIYDLFLSPELTLIASSPTIAHIPPDWPGMVYYCGFFMGEKSEFEDKIADDLVAFLKHDSKPVFLGLGSLMQTAEDETLEIFCQAVQQSGVRAIIQTPNPEKVQQQGVFAVRSLPHQQVFAECALVVHHGGAGTTQTALSAGVPSVVIAHAFDQSYWGQILQNYGCGGRTLLRHKLKASDLADAISEVLEKPELRIHAQELAQKIKHERALSKAVDLLEELYSQLSLNSV